MKICVLSGSPKGKYSITYQTVRFLEKKCPKDSFETVHVGQRIHALERNLTPALEAIMRADLLLFCYPVYTFTVPSQLHRFIELLKESGADVSGKYAAQVSTSKHFYDVTALAKTLDYAIATPLTQPANFYGVGGMKIFRDLIWLMRGMMKADHAFYKEHGLYDFPQKKRGTALKMQLVGALLSNPKAVKKMGIK